MAKFNKYLQYKNKGKFVKPTPEQIENWLRSNAIDFKSMNEQYRVCNPDGDTKFSMSISKESALVHDFRPNHQDRDGTFIKFVSLYKNISIKEAIDEVCGKNINFINNKSTKEQEVENDNYIELPKGCKSLRDKTDSKLWSINMSYLINERGLDKDIIYRSNIHYLGTNIVVPYYQYGMIVFYQSRAQMDKKFNFPPVSVTSKRAGDFLYGFDDVEPCSEIIIMESIFNSLSYGAGAVATGGAKLKDGQLNLLRILNPHTVILAPDNDGAGISSVEKDFLALNKMKRGDLFKDIFYCLPPYSKDSQKDWNDMKREGVDVSKYILKNMKKLSVKNIFEGIDYKFV
jgi:DNA primase